MNEVYRKNFYIWLLPTCLSIVLFAIAQQDFLTFHLLAELTAIMIAFMMFAVAVNTFGASKDNLLLILACAYFWVGINDLFHAMSFPGMNLFIENSTNISAQIWLTARFLEAGALLFVAICSKFLPNGWRLFALYGVLSIASGILIYTGYFPDTFIEETGLTLFKILSEYLIVVALILAFYFFSNHKNALSERQLFFIKASIFFTALAELSFTAYLSAIDGFNLVGHILKVFSYWMIYQALIAGTLKRPFEEIDMLTKAIEQSPSGVIITDADCNIEFANAQYEKISGYSREEIVGKRPDFLKADGISSEDSKELFYRMEKGQTWHGVFINKRKDGVIHHDQATISCIKNQAGKTQHYLGTMEDMTERAMVRNFILDKDNALAQTLLGSIAAIVNLLEARDPYTAGHGDKVSSIAVRIGKELGLSNSKLEELRLAALVHDIGKIKVPMEILNKPSQLTKAEFAIIKEHSQIGFDVLNQIQFPWTVPLMVLYHHERMDGSGYPNGLKGQAIPLGARILAVADVLDSVVAHRPYRPALGEGKAFDIISQGRGTLFDEKIVDVALRLKETLLNFQRPQS